MCPFTFILILFAWGISVAFDVQPWRMVDGRMVASWRASRNSNICVRLWYLRSFDLRL